MKKEWPIEKTCLICKEKFLCFPPNARGLYCSQKCKRLAGNKRTYLWRKTHPEKVKRRQAIDNKKQSIKRAVERLDIKKKKIIEMKKKLAMLDLTPPKKR